MGIVEYCKENLPLFIPLLILTVLFLIFIIFLFCRQFKKVRKGEKQNYLLMKESQVVCSEYHSECHAVSVQRNLPFTHHGQPIKLDKQNQSEAGEDALGSIRTRRRAGTVQLAEIPQPKRKCASKCSTTRSLRITSHCGPWLRFLPGVLRFRLQ